MTFLAFCGLTLATYRLVRLWVVDDITEPLRERLFRALSDEWGELWGWRERLHTLLNCQWCLGVWVGAAMAAGWATYADWWEAGWRSAVPFGVLALALAAAQSFVHLAESVLESIDSKLSPF